MYLPTWPQIKHTCTYSHTHRPQSIPTFLSSLLKPITEVKLKGIYFAGVAHGSLCGQSFWLVHSYSLSGPSGFVWFAGVSQGGLSSEVWRKGQEWLGQTVYVSVGVRKWSGQASKTLRVCRSLFHSALLFAHTITLLWVTGFSYHVESQAFLLL